MVQKEKILKIILLLIFLGSLYHFSVGVKMHGQVLGEEAAFHALQTEYYTTNKEMRDAAPAGSDLNNKLIEIKNYPSHLMYLKLVGVGHILRGIFLMLTCIFLALASMPFRLAHVLQHQSPPSRKKK